MSNIPDFVMQVQEIQRQIGAQVECTADDWKDDVKKRFYEQYIDSYNRYIELYIHGGADIEGKGLNDLLVFFDEQMQKMEGLTGVPADVSFMCAAGLSHTGSIINNYGHELHVESLPEVIGRDGIVHNERLERDYWNEEDMKDENYNFRPGNGTRPGQYSNEEIKQIMDYRSQDDFYKDFRF